MKAEISVIIPVFNSESFLERCLNSVINQTFKKIEIIIINDGSTDNSLSIVNQYQKKDSRIIVFNQENKGISFTRNKGIQLSNSELIYFIDSDDEIALEMLEYMFDKSKEDDADIVHSLITHVDDECEKLQKLHNLYEKDFDYIKEILMFNISSCTPINLYKKSLFIKNHLFFPENQYYEDSAMMLKLFFYAKNIVVVDKSFYKYYRNIPNSITTQSSYKHINDVIIGLSQIKEFLKKNSIYDKYEIYFLIRVKRTLVNYILFLNQSIKNKNEKIEKIKYLWQLFEEKKYFNSSLDVLLYLYFILYDILKINIKQVLTDENLTEIFKEKINKYLTSDLGILNFFIEYIDKRNIMEIYVYGAGEVFNKIKPYLEERKIKILGIFEKNKEILNMYEKDLQVTSFQSFENGKPILITSLMFYEEIVYSLNDYMEVGNKKFDLISLDKIVFSTNLS